MKPFERIVLGGLIMLFAVVSVAHAGEYGDFLIAVYEEWVRNDVGKTFVMNFEWALNAWIGNPSPVCVHAERCGRSVVLEHNGDVYTCDHCVYPRYRLGNITTEPLSDMVDRSLQSGFGVSKETSLPPVQGMRRAGGLQRGLPKGSLHEDVSGRTRDALPLPGLQEVLSPHPEVLAGHDPVAGKWAACVSGHGCVQGAAGDQTRHPVNLPVPPKLTKGLP